MLAMEELLCELSNHEEGNQQGLPPGFRFHPTDEELITCYLASKVFNGSFTDVKFAEVDLNKCEPWELPDVAKMGEREWYLFSLRDRKYPTGLTTNRATGAGYWKATGKDREVYSASSGALLGMKKTLVFYKGRAPRGEKTKWVMHEYRLDGDFSLSLSHRHRSTHPCKEEWVICRVFHKSGEKKNPLLQVQRGHLDASPSPTKSSLPPLLASQFQSSPRDFQSQILIHQQEQNNLSHTHLFPMQQHAFQPSFPIEITNARNHHPSSEVFFKSQLSQQNCTTLKFKQETIPKVRKLTETTFYQYQKLLLGDANSSWMDKLNPNPGNYQNTMPLEMDAAGVLGFSGAAKNAAFRDTSTSIEDFNKASLQQMLDAPIGIDSWPHAQHV